MREKEKKEKCENYSREHLLPAISFQKYVWFYTYKFSFATGLSAMPEIDIFGEQTIIKHFGEEEKERKILIKIKSGAKTKKASKLIPCI